MLYGFSANGSNHFKVKGIELSKLNNYSELRQKQSKVALINLEGLSSLQKKKLETLFIDFGVSLSCVSITYTGSTAEAGMAIVMAGYFNELMAILEWLWCQGGYEVLNPYEESWV